MKKIIALLLSLVMLMSATVLTGSALLFGDEADDTLRFNEDGSFTILQIADIQDGFWLRPLTEEFFERVLDIARPDLVVLTGDNISQGWGLTYGLTKMNINNFMSIFDQRGIKVAMVFGNHDDEDNLLGKELQWKIYDSYDCFVGVADTEELTGYGTYHVPIMSSTEPEKKAFNLWFFDSQAYNVENDLGGYAAVAKDQIEWYIKTEKALTKENGGTPIPSMAFQHIIIPEVYGDSYVMIYRHLEATELVDLGITKENISELDSDKYYVDGNGIVYEIVGDPSIYNENYDVNWRGDIYVIPPEYINEDTFVGEDGGAPLYSNGQADALVDTGNVLGIAVGHDHVNSFVMPYRTMDVIQSPTSSFGSYGDENRGARVITLNEKDLSTYDTDVIFFRDLFDVTDPLMANRIIVSTTNEDSLARFEAFFMTIYYRLVYALQKVFSLLKLPI